MRERKKGRDGDGGKVRGAEERRCRGVWHKKGSGGKKREGEGSLWGRKGTQKGGKQRRGRKESEGAKWRRVKQGEREIEREGETEEGREKKEN